MKISKEKDIALLLQPFGVKDSSYLAVSALLCFDLLEPWRLYDEQALWRTVESELGPGAMLDPGMPKIRSEFLAAGKCYTPRDSTPVAASEVLVGVGGRNKRLFVYGERYWTPRGGLLRTEGFTEMAITWANAFGGKSFAHNPMGKGLEPVPLPDGRRLRPLPNIEDPARLVGSPDDRPQPAGFGPLDVTWPQRNVNLGSYDTRWRRERWPNPPDDFDYAYYNAAPPDQQFDGFFSGEELIEIRNMHPDHQTILSDFPSYRVRCFLTRKSALWDPDSHEEMTEVPLHPETLWLFPGQLRGVLLLRGAVPVLDDEYKDVVRVFLAKEGREDTPQSREFYIQMQQKALDRSVPIDQEPLRQAEKVLGAAMKQARNLPKEIARIQNALLGRSPVMERTPQEYAGMGALTLTGTRTVLNTLGSTADGLRSRFGFLPLPGTPLQGIADKLDLAGQRLEHSVRGLEKTVDRSAAYKQELQAEAKSTLELLPETLRSKAAAALDPPQPQPSWKQTAFAFAVDARRALEADPSALQRLRELGFTDRTIRNAWLGWHPEARTLPAAEWGLDTETWGEELTLPAGLVIPWFMGRDTAGLAFWNETGETVLNGSQTSARLLPAATPESPVIVGPDHLQALYLEQEIGDACHVLVLSSPEGVLDRTSAEVLAASAEQSFPPGRAFPNAYAESGS